ncbi:Uncharacterized protein BM_BM10346 [Brugia malayi]|uniref:Bm10346 n=1 Tax=Brugia malayi TaxID=6279 RepID=A0A0K0IMX8_BRUMA|nr:Uncharacterized protein BM_BM10346 [Brugia malayi]CDP97674.1 Bm10346 [Brugia malayi]VIO93188.1 Uncharacterized protein BM_BM10346 [Brugia malayi]
MIRCEEWSMMGCDLGTTLPPFSLAKLTDSLLIYPIKVGADETMTGSHEPLGKLRWEVGQATEFFMLIPRIPPVSVQQCRVPSRLLFRKVRSRAYGARSFLSRRNCESVDESASVVIGFEAERFALQAVKNSVIAECEEENLYFELSQNISRMMSYLIDQDVLLEVPLSIDILFIRTS